MVGINWGIFQRRYRENSYLGASVMRLMMKFLGLMDIYSLISGELWYVLVPAGQLILSSLSMLH